MQLHFVQAAVSVIRNSGVVRYLGAAIVRTIFVEILVGTYGSVRYSVEVRYSESVNRESTVHAFALKPCKHVTCSEKSMEAEKCTLFDHFCSR